MELPLALKTPGERYIWYGLKLECAPQAVLRDLWRVVKDHRIAPWQFERHELHDSGGRQASGELKELFRASYRIDPTQLLDGAGQYREAVKALRTPARTAMRTPYVPRK